MPTEEKPASDVNVDIQLTSSTNCEQKDVVHVSLEQRVARSAPAIVRAYMEQNKIPVQELLLSQGFQLTEEEKKCAEQLRILGDWLNARIEEVVRPLQDTPLNDRFSQFKRIAQGMFLRGINWGRIAILFAVSLKFIGICGKDFVGRIFEFLVQIIVEKLCKWIVDSGGWTAVKEYVKDLMNSKTNMDRMIIFTLGACCVTLFVYAFIVK